MIPIEDGPPNRVAGLVSVVITYYNEAAYIAQAVGSVLAQTHRAVEVFVVDDGSTEEPGPALADLLGDPRLHLIRQANAGLPAARNTGLARARGEALHFLDADDWLHPEALAHMLAALRATPGAGAVVCDAMQVDPEGRPLSRHEPASALIPDADFFTSVWARCFFPALNVLLDAGWLHRVGGWDADCASSEDHDLWLRLAAAGCPFHFLPEVLASRRIRPNSKSRQVDRETPALLRLHARMAEREPDRVARAAPVGIAYVQNDLQRGTAWARDLQTHLAAVRAQLAEAEAYARHVEAEIGRKDGYIATLEAALAQNRREG